MNLFLYLTVSKVPSIAAGKVHKIRFYNLGVKAYQILSHLLYWIRLGLVKKFLPYWLISAVDLLTVPSVVLSLCNKEDCVY